jgi:enoyl reductase-like protein
MNTFNIDDMIFESINNAMRQAEADLTEQQVHNIVNAIDGALPGLIQLLTQDTKEEWKQEAIESGTGWGEKYARAIMSKISNKEGSVYIDESAMDSTGKKSMMFVQMIEKGVKSWSIKDALLASEKAKTGKDGIKYIIVPFPVAAPRQKGQGKPLSRFGGREMSSEVHDLVKSGGRAPKGTTDISGQDISGLTKWTTEQRHEQYSIFRCVSNRSVGWQYPTIGATPVFPSIIDYVNKRIQEILNDFCLAVIKEYS